jgi:hypothetical protein
VLKLAGILHHPRKRNWMRAAMSMSSHQSARMKNDEWLTPPEIIEALGSYCSFDLDPCSPIKRPWPTAMHHFTKEDDGLSKEWLGNVWMNPPFGREAIKWMRKIASHGQGIALLAVRSETSLFFECVWPKADAILFIKGRPHFHYVDGTRAKFNSGAPICLIAYGAENHVALNNSGLGAVIPVKGIHSSPSIVQVEAE